MTKRNTISAVLIAATVFAAPMAYTAAAAEKSSASYSRTQAQPAISAERARLINALKPTDDMEQRLAKIKSSLKSLNARGATKTSQKAALSNALTETKALDRSLKKLKSGFARAEKRVGSTGGVVAVNDLREQVDLLQDALTDAMKDLEADDKLGNFEIQRLMSQYNQSEQLASSVLKKKDDTANSIIQKVG